MRLTAMALLLLVALTGCDSSTAPEDGTTMTAQVNGVPLAATRASAVIRGAGNFILANIIEGNGTQVSLRLSLIGKPGTYPLGVATGTSGGLGDVTIANATYTTPLSGSAGTVTLTTVSLTRIAGTFSFTAQRLTSSGYEYAAVTKGSFDLVVTGTGTLDIPANANSTVSGTVNGAAFVPTEVTVAQGPASGALVLTLRQGSRVLSVNIPGANAVGSFPLSGATTRWIRLDDIVNGFNSTWGGTNATSTGTVAITSLTTARVAGTINATLTPTFAGLNTPPAVVALTFDIGLP